MPGTSSVFVNAMFRWVETRGLGSLHPPLSICGQKTIPIQLKDNYQPVLNISLQEIERRAKKATRTIRFNKHLKDCFRKLQTAEPETFRAQILLLKKTASLSHKEKLGLAQKMAERIEHRDRDSRLHAIEAVTFIITDLGLPVEETVFIVEKYLIKNLWLFDWEIEKVTKENLVNIILSLPTNLQLSFIERLLNNQTSSGEYNYKIVDVVQAVVIRLAKEQRDLFIDHFIITPLSHPTDTQTRNKAFKLIQSVTFDKISETELLSLAEKIQTTMKISNGVCRDALRIFKNLPKNPVLAKYVFVTTLPKLQHPDPAIRKLAIEVLIKFYLSLDTKDKCTTAQHVARLFNDPDIDNRETALESFCHFLNSLYFRENVDQIINRLDDIEPRIRTAALKVLVDSFSVVSTENKLAIIEKTILMINDPAESVRKTVLHLLQSDILFGKYQPTEVHQKAYDLFIKAYDLLDDTEHSIRSRAAFALIKCIEKLPCHLKNDLLQKMMGITGSEKYLRLLDSGYIRFADGGISESDTSRVMEALLPFFRYPESNLSLGEVAFSIQKISLQQLLQNFSAENTPQKLGRSEVYSIKSEGNKVLVVKYLKPGQKPEELVRELAWLHLFKNNKIGLHSQLPEPVLDANSNPTLFNFDGRQAIAFKTTSDYYRYLDDPKLSEDQFMAGLKTAIHDAGILSRYGIYHLVPVPLYHNREQGHTYRKDQGRYTIDPRITLNLRTGMGRLDNWVGATLYGNMGLTGMRDLEELASIDNILNKNLLPELDGLKDRDKSVALFNTMLMGNWYLSAVLFVGNRIRMEQQSRAKQISSDDELWKDQTALKKYTNMLQEIFAAGYAGQWMIDHDTAKNIIATRVRWSRLALQCAFFMTPTHAAFVRDDDKRNDFPTEIYGPDVSVEFGSYRSRGKIKTFDPHLGWIGADGDKQKTSLGPVNGPNPLLEFSKAFWGMAFPPIVQHNDDNEQPHVLV